jgi:UDP-N-acetyl-D-mannosaminuronic acid transferase (WecB/TagA/CpsF family)
MAVSEAGAAVARLVDNDYAIEQLVDAAGELRGAYKRAAGRRAAKAAEDKKLYRRLQRAASSLNEGVSALQADRKRPRRRWPARILGGAALPAAADVATNEDMRAQILGAVSGSEEQGGQ